MFPLNTLITNTYPREKKFLRENYHVENVINNWFMSQLCVHRDMKHLGSLESTQAHSSLFRALQTDFPRASHLDGRTLTHESIV